MKEREKREGIKRDRKKTRWTESRKEGRLKEGRLEMEDMMEGE